MLLLAHIKDAAFAEMVAFFELLPKSRHSLVSHPSCSPSTKEASVLLHRRFHRDPSRFLIQ
jgi:hypothetical protein